MKNDIKEILIQLKGKNDAYNAIIDERIALLEKEEAAPWLHTRTKGFEDIFVEYAQDMTKPNERAVQKLTQSGTSEKKNVYVKYDGVCVLCESINTDVILLPIEEGLERYAHVAQKFFKKRKENKAVSKNDIRAQAFPKSGFFLYIPDQPYEHEVKIHIYDSLGTDGIYDNGYNMIIVGKNAHATIIHESLPVPFDGTAISASYTEFFLEPEAHCTYTAIQGQSTNIYSTATKDIYIGYNAVMLYNDIVIGGKFVNQHIHAYLYEEESNFQLQGIALAHEDQQYETYNLIDNIAKNTQGKSIYKNIVAGKSHVLFEGLIKVEKNADMTNSYLEDHTILLGKDARSQSIPSLEIEANEVKASHGATIGNIDKEQLFYAEARGLSESEAIRLIITGFIQPIIDVIHDDGIASRVFTYLHSFLEHARD